jgi:hypothetical protein
MKMLKMQDAGIALEKALAAFFQPLSITVEGHSMRSWASATFQGVQHVLVISAPGQDDIAEKLARLRWHEFALRSQLVADIAVMERNAAGRFEIEALIVDEPCPMPRDRVQPVAVIPRAARSEPMSPGMGASAPSRA